MAKLLLPPRIVGYAGTVGNNVVATRLDGGASRMRLDKIGAAHEVQVQWMLTNTGYNYLMAFFRTEIDFGSLPFTIDLPLDSSTRATYTARIVPGSLRLDEYKLSAYAVSATLEILPQTHNAAADQVLIAAGPE